ncbi:CAP domain-containing protein [Kitasatospora sp. NPDC058965]|uniref:CAP domain-containing protein n=1 Tax=Kitasatospora sp. NPDC058965 TaxID=3346682 RepID=UPI0036857538
MVTDVDAHLVVSARNGDRLALERLVGTCTPLVYNLVGRALSRELDADGAVQDVMREVVRGLPRLRDPRALRAWVVAVAVDRIRRLHQGREVCGPGSGVDFADLTIWELALSDQRLEAARAVSWLDDGQRELASLWWLEQGGLLDRAELVDALGLPPEQLAAQLAGMKDRLDAARCLVRALDTVPRCPELAGVTAAWDGLAGPEWRKQIVRHIRYCGYCYGAAYGLVPVEGLLAGLALVPLPIGLAGRVVADLPTSLGGEQAAQAATTGPSGPSAHRTHPRTGPGGHGRSRRGKSGSDPWLLKVTGAVVATATIGGAVAMAGWGSGSSTSTDLAAPDRSAPVDLPTREGAAPAAPVMAGFVGSSPTALPTGPTAAPSASPSPARTTPSATPSQPGQPATPSAAPSSARPTTAPTSAAATTASPSGGPTTSSGTAEDQVLAVINQARAAQGLPALTRTAGLDRSATGHTQVMLSGCGLNHVCAGEPELGARETAAGVSWSSCGENIGEGGPVANTNDAMASMAVGLTNSMLAEKAPNDGHRRNILSADFHHIGISVIRDSNGMVWMTQDFSD